MVEGDGHGDDVPPIPMAVKIIHEGVVPREAWLDETNLLLRVRSFVDAVYALEAHGAPLALEDRGARHVPYMFGRGYEPSLHEFDPALPAMGAFIIALEPLDQTLTSFLMCRRAEAPGDVTAPVSPLQPPAVEVLLRIARDVSLGLAFLAHKRLVVRYRRSLPNAPVDTPLPMINLPLITPRSTLTLSRTM